MTATDTKTLDYVLTNNPPNTIVYIAEDNHGHRTGFIHLRGDVDYFSNETYGHVSDIVVTSESQGRGIGRALMAAGEEWARRQGYPFMTLFAFVQNTRATAMYESLGYGRDMQKYIKEL
jgi:ribosomal protein S18 acetylase RimI-like enzyme